MKLTEPVKKILEQLRERQSRHQGQPRPHPDAGQARRHRQAGDPAGRSGLRARPGAQLRAEPAGLRSALPFPAGDRGRALGLCRAARLYRGRRRRPLPAQIPTDPQAQQRQQPVARQGERDPGGHRQRQGRAAARLLGDRLHDLSRLRRRLRADATRSPRWPARPRRTGSPW